MIQLLLLCVMTVTMVEGDVSPSHHPSNTDQVHQVMPNLQLLDREDCTGSDNTSSPTILSSTTYPSHSGTFSREYATEKQTMVFVDFDMNRSKLKELSRMFRDVKKRRKRFIGSLIVSLGFFVAGSISDSIARRNTNRRIDDVARDVQDIRSIVTSNSAVLNTLVSVNKRQDKVLMHLVRSTEELHEKNRQQDEVLMHLVNSTEELHDNFSELRDQLADFKNDVKILSQQLDTMRNELASNIEFSSWLTTYINWAFAIHNGEDRLKILMEDLEMNMTEIERDRRKQEYTDYYEGQDIEGKMNNIFRLTAKPRTVTTKNLFDLYVEEKECNVRELTRLVLTINILAISSGKQIEAYYYLLGRDQPWVNSHMTQFYTNLYDVRRQYERKVWYCFQNVISIARDTVNTIVNEESYLDGSNLTYTVQQTLSELCPLYDWAAVQFEEAGNVQICHQRFTLRGDQFFINEAKKLLVFYKDHSEDDQECSDVINMSTFIPFVLCEDCTDNNLQITADNLLSGRQCEDFYPVQFKRQFGYCRAQNPSRVVKNEVQTKKISFFAGGVKHTDPCLKEDACSEHGECKHIPYTKHHICICNHFYSGDDCSQYQGQEHVNNITSFMKELRQNFATASGIPNEIDVYYKVTKLSTQLKLMQKDIQESIKFNRLISLYSSVITQGEFIATVYNKLLSGELSEGTFAEHLAGRDFPYIISGLEFLILGKGSLLSQDLMDTLKRTLVAEKGSDYACTREYSDIISEKMKDLITLDEVIVEAYLRLHTRMIYLRDEVEQKKIVEHSKTVTEAAKARHTQYAQYWKDNSCDKITEDEDIERKYCNMKESYEGMTINIHCNKNKQATVSSVTCRKENGKLKWDSTASCIYLWGSWGAWSACDQICDTGKQTRTRTKLDGEEDTETKTCTIRPCTDYEWSGWGSWSTCSKTCNTGYQQRTRKQLAGETDTSTRACEVHPCSHFAWGSWGPWSTCNKLCGSGEKTRTRRKLSGQAEQETRSCLTYSCSEFSWSGWSGCNGKGFGTQTRRRRTRPHGRYAYDTYDCNWWSR